jgi:hypothetical protein
VRDRGAVHAEAAGERLLADEALVADRVQDDPGAERAARVGEAALERLTQRLRREDEQAAERRRGDDWIVNDLTFLAFGPYGA